MKKKHKKYKGIGRYIDPSRNAEYVVNMFYIY
jgi:hypothetical protein